MAHRHDMGRNPHEHDLAMFAASLAKDGETPAEALASYARNYGTDTLRRAQAAYLAAKKNGGEISNADLARLAKASAWERFLFLFADWRDTPSYRVFIRALAALGAIVLVALIVLFGPY